MSLTPEPKVCSRSATSSHLSAPSKTSFALACSLKQSSQWPQRTILDGGAVDAGYADAFLDAVLTRVMRGAVSIPAVATASVLHSAAVGGSVVGVVGPL